MNTWAALAGGFAGTLVLTTVLRAATELNLTRMDLPFLLGTVVTADRARAKVIGYAAHFGFGLSSPWATTDCSPRSADTTGGWVRCSG
jgi:hypothetical protein